MNHNNHTWTKNLQVQLNVLIYIKRQRIAMTVEPIKAPNYCSFRLFLYITALFSTNNYVGGFVVKEDIGPNRHLIRPSRPRTAKTHSVLTNRGKSGAASSMGLWSRDEEIEGSDRLKACVPYILPLLDGDQFGTYIYERVPPLGFVHDMLLGPLVDIYHHIPFLGLGLFVALTLGTRFNTSMDRNVRFSAQQAALIDVALIFPELIASSFIEQPLPRYIVEPCANFVWYAYMSAVAYSLWSNLKGKKPDQIPYISASADLMVGPF